MFMQEHRIYYLYCIENKVNSKIYVGVHSTENFDDGYMGSGVALRKAINKYGIENFEKSIIKFFGSSDEMYLAESEIVDAQFVNSPLTYNMKIGGFGGWNPRTKKHTAETIAKMRISGSGENNGFYGKIHTSESKAKIISYLKTREIKDSHRKTMSEKHSGENNPMFGITPHNAKAVVYNGVEYKSIAAAARAAGINYSTFKRKYI
ncbi:segC-like homing endonuclease [Erwinia phage COW86c]